MRTLRKMAWTLGFLAHGLVTKKKWRNRADIAETQKREETESRELNNKQSLKEVKSSYAGVKKIFP